MPDFIVTTKHSVLSRFKVTARTKYDAVAALTTAMRGEGRGLPDNIDVAGVESTAYQIHSVGVVKDKPGDPEPEAQPVEATAYDTDANVDDKADEAPTEDAPSKRRR